MAEHQNLRDRNAHLESDFTRLNNQICALKEEKASSEAKYLSLLAEKEKIESKNIELDEKLTMMRENLITAENTVKTLSAEKAAAESDKSALNKQIDILDNEKLATENNTQKLSKQNEELKKTIQTMKAELHDLCRTTMGPFDEAFCANPDEISFTEVSFDALSHNGENNSTAMQTDDDDDSESSCNCMIPNRLFETPTKSGRRVAKVYHSPKKWRRMVRDNRLQSIFVDQ